MTHHLPVLVVEDDPSIRHLMKEALDEAGYTAATARDGREAITWLLRRVPLAVVLDIGLPYVDGTEVARASRELYDGDVPIVVVSANGHAEDDAREVGASGFLRKPFDLDELVSVVRRAVASRESLAGAQREINDRRALERDAARERRGVLQRDADSAAK